MTYCNNCAVCKNEAWNYCSTCDSHYCDDHTLTDGYKAGGDLEMHCTNCGDAVVAEETP